MRAARQAGKKPESTPVTSETSSAMPTTGSDMVAGRNCWITNVSGQAMASANQPAQQADARGLDQKLQQDRAPLGADGLADADLARPLGHRDEHDVHDADAADEQRQPGDEQPDGGDGAAHA